MFYQVDGHGGTHNIQDKHEAMHKMKAHYGEKEHSIENIAIVQANKEFGEQGSDAQVRFFFTQYIVLLLV